MSAISACRTAALGGHVERCDDCGLTRIAYNSCRNRHCPQCQGATRAEWLAAREAELLPVPYSHVVFTLPPAAAEIAFHNNAPVYGLLMRRRRRRLPRCRQPDTSRRRGRPDRRPAHLRADAHHHPHVHCLVPGGGVALDGQSWVEAKPNFLLSVRALSVSSVACSSADPKPPSAGPSCASSALSRHSPNGPLSPSAYAR